MIVTCEDAGKLDLSLLQLLFICIEERAPESFSRAVRCALSFARIDTLTGEPLRFNPCIAPPFPTKLLRQRALRAKRIWWRRLLLLNIYGFIAVVLVAG